MLTRDVTKKSNQNIYRPYRFSSSSFKGQLIWTWPVFRSLVSGCLCCFNLLMCCSTMMSQPARSFSWSPNRSSGQTNRTRSLSSDWDRCDTIITDKPEPPVHPLVNTNHIQFRWAQTNQTEQANGPELVLTGSLSQLKQALLHPSKSITRGPGAGPIQKLVLVRPPVCCERCFYTTVHSTKAASSQSSRLWSCTRGRSEVKVIKLM